jgi:rhamnosyl/mannosyltransferase
MGGAEQAIHQIARGSKNFGISAEVLSLSRNRSAKTTEVDGYLVHRARLNLQIASTSISLSSFFKFAHLVKSADVVHYHFPWPFMDVVHFATRMNKPSLVTYHSDIIRQRQLLKLYRPLQQKFLASVDCIVATSPNYLATSEVLKRHADKVRVIPLGVDRTAYPVPSPECANKWREKLGSKFFLFIGVIRYYKGLHILLQAAKGTNFPVVIVGAGPIEEELKTQALKLGLENIFFLGHLPDEDKVTLLSLCLAVVFPSHLRSEAFGMTLLEGAMFGKPLISSEIGTGTTFINIGGETGIVVPPSDPDALREAMRFLWDHPEDAKAMGNRAEERYQSHFKADAMVASYASLYNDIVASRRP